MGIDWNGLISCQEDMNDNAVEVDPPHQPLADEDYRDLKREINPLDPSSQY